MEVHSPLHPPTWQDVEGEEPSTVEEVAVVAITTIAAATTTATPSVPCVIFATIKVILLLIVGTGLMRTLLLKEEVLLLTQTGIWTLEQLTTLLEN